MVGIVLLYFVGKAFYDLAAIHNRQKWLFAIIGLGSYYGGLFTGGIALGILSEAGVVDLNDTPDIVLGIMALPVGVLCCWGTYRYLKSTWERAEEEATKDVLDADLMN